MKGVDGDDGDDEYVDGDDDPNDDQNVGNDDGFGLPLPKGWNSCRISPRKAKMLDLNSTLQTAAEKS